MTMTPLLAPWIGGSTIAADGHAAETVLYPFTRAEAVRVVPGTAEDFESAVAAAERGFAAMRAMPRHARRDILARVAEIMGRDRQTLATE
ncbi:MAG: aldehyde dehydrogenase family protein, partial [Gemmatimonadota bacterium]|nr:aldehyde dehydrogenase family protein [Gemmatimonadota bacterium]